MNATIGRSLILKQAILTCPVLALGAYGYYCVASLDGLAGTDSAAAATLAAAITSAGWHIALAALIVTVAMVAASFFFIQGALALPLAELSDAAEQLALGNRAVAISGDERRDEIGSLARSLTRLRDEAAAPVRTPMTSPVDNGDQRIHQLNDRIERFSSELGATVRRLGSMTRRLGEAAAEMTKAARHANDGSDQATAASSHAAGDVSSVATASEQLLDSIEEISRQVVQSTNVVRAAVERAVETNVGMGRLSAAAQKVGDVVSLISRIAAQTNLLALNATIEAARAGEAGRGFAVVAQEVKTLATQTAKATQDITGQIADMQEATDLSVEAIDKIQTKIAEVEHISTIIASAVHEQGAATQEIARNVRSAAAGTATMSGHIENVVRSVGETSTSAASISSLARELDEIATGMTDMVAAFGQTLRAA